MLLLGSPIKLSFNLRKLREIYLETTALLIRIDNYGLRFVRVKSNWVSIFLIQF